MQNVSCSNSKESIADVNVCCLEETLQNGHMVVSAELPQRETLDNEQNVTAELPQRETLDNEQNVTAESPKLETLINEQDLPQPLSSNHNDIPLNSSKEFEEISSVSCPEEKPEDPEETMDLTKENMKDLIEVILNGHVSGTMDKQELSLEVKALGCSTLEIDNPKFENSIVTNEELMDNREEPSIEESCESQLVYAPPKTAEDKIPKSPEIAKPQGNITNKPTTLLDDSRLVKIPLPTSSMNLIQSNAQFLNKSRNFLNFITEKSTNIMEKTLLPQHIAVRYNSLLKHSDGFYGTVKKNSEELNTSIAESTTTNLSASESQSIANLSGYFRSVPESTGNTTPTHSSNAESPRSETNFTPEFPTDIHVPASINGFDLPKPEASPVKSAISDLSDQKLECEVTQMNLSNPINEDGQVPELENLVGLDNYSALTDLSHSLLEHPIYLTLVRDYAKVREEKLKLDDRVKHLEERNKMLESQNSAELFNVQLETMEKTVERLKGELRSATSIQEELGREYAAANKERESMVMKYAVSEKQLIDTQRYHRNLLNLVL